MHHHRYQVPAIVLASEERQEASRLIFLLTSELGLVSALAQGVRLPQAKLRAHLQPFSHLRIELVRGREWWRVVGVGPGDFSYHSFGQPARLLLARVFNLLRRLLPGEGAPMEIFEELYSAAWSLAQEQPPESPRLADFELLLVARLLHHLGYLPADRLVGERNQILLAVNESLAHSHL